MLLNTINFGESFSPYRKLLSPGAEFISSYCSGPHCKLNNCRDTAYFYSARGSTVKHKLISTDIIYSIMLEVLKYTQYAMQRVECVNISVAVSVTRLARLSILCVTIAKSNGSC